MSVALTFLGSGDAFDTHMGPSMLERRRDAEYESAEDGMVVTLG